MQVSTKEAYENIAPNNLVVFNFPLPNAYPHLNVCGIFEQLAPNDKGEEVLCQGAVIGSVKMAHNLEVWYSTEDSILGAAADGTYSVCNNRWVLGVLATSYFKDELHSIHSCLPFLFFWCRTETNIAYSAALIQMILILHYVYGYPIVEILRRFRIGIADHSTSIHNGFKHVLGGDRIIGEDDEDLEGDSEDVALIVKSCYAHWMRKVDENSGKLSDQGVLRNRTKKDYVREVIMPRLRGYLHCYHFYIYTYHIFTHTIMYTFYLFITIPNHYNV